MKEEIIILVESFETYLETLDGQGSEDKALNHFLDIWVDAHEDPEDYILAKFFLSKFLHEDGWELVADIVDSIDLYVWATENPDLNERREMLEEAIDLWPENYMARLNLYALDENTFIQNFEEDFFAAIYDQGKSLPLDWLDFEDQMFFDCGLALSEGYIRNGLLLRADQVLDLIRETKNYSGLSWHELDIIVQALKGDHDYIIQAFNDLSASGFDFSHLLFPLLVSHIISGQLEEGEFVARNLALAYPDSWHGLFDEYGQLDIIGVLNRPLTSSHYDRDLDYVIALMMPFIISSPYTQWALKEIHRVITGLGTQAPAQNSLHGMKDDDGERSELFEVLDIIEDLAPLLRQEKEGREPAPSSSNVLHFPSGIKESPRTEEIHWTRGLNMRQVKALASYGIVDREDFRAYTYDEVFQIKCIGPVALETLLDNGVEFKDRP